MRLGGGVPQVGAPLRRHGGHQGVLGPRDARLVEEDVGADELLPLEAVVAAHLEARAQLFECEEVRIHPAAADDVATGRRQRDLSEAREQRAGEQDRRADLRAEARVECLRARRAWIDPEVVGAGPFHRGTEVHQQFAHRLDVANAWHLVQLHQAIGEECGGEDREGGVLVTGGTDRAAQGATTVHDEAWRHHSSSLSLWNRSSGGVAAHAGPRGVLGMQDASGIPGWVGPVVAISLLVIALVMGGLAIGLVFALRGLKDQVDQQRNLLKEWKELLDVVKDEAGAGIRTSRGLRRAVVRGVRRTQEKLHDLETLYDVVYEEVEDTALDAASTLRAIRTGGSVLSRLRRLIIPGR